MIVQTVYRLAIQVASSKRSVKEIALVFWVISVILSLARCMKYLKKTQQLDALD